MATITFTLSDSNLQRLIDATCNLYLYDEFGGGFTRAQFTKKIWVDRMKKDVFRYERKIKTRQVVGDYFLANPITEPVIT